MWHKNRSIRINIKFFKSDYANDRLTSHGDGGDGVDDVGEDDVVAGEVEFDGLGGRSIALKLASKMEQKAIRLLLT